MRAIILLLTLIPFFSFAQSMQPKTPDDVVEQIKKHVTCDWMSKTVDVYKAGDPQIPLKGIAVCMFADMPTLEKAVELGCNFIITHEPFFTVTSTEQTIYRTTRFFLQKRNSSKKTTSLYFAFTIIFT